MFNLLNALLMILPYAASIVLLVVVFLIFIGIRMQMDTNNQVARIMRARGHKPYGRPQYKN